MIITIKLSKILIIIIKGIIYNKNNLPDIDSLYVLWLRRHNTPRYIDRVILRAQDEKRGRDGPDGQILDNSNTAY